MSQNQNPSPPQSLSHLDARNNPTMVDVGQKSTTQRLAIARALVFLPPEVMRELRDGELYSRKGPVFQTAIVAGTMAAKKTSDLIPFCHPLPLESCKFQIFANQKQDVEIYCQVKVSHKTGVEMEALTGASVAALTIYDMCKALSHEIVIGPTELLCKKGGKSDYVHPDFVSPF